MTDTFKRRYVTVTGEIHEHIYKYKKYSERNQKPKCVHCGTRLILVKKRTPLVPGHTDNIGYICETCNLVYIIDKYKVLMIKDD